MANNFRKAKIQKYYTSLRIRKVVAQQQLENGGILTVDAKFDEIMTARQKGYLEAIELILQELEHEFDLYNPENPNVDISKLDKD
jgi:hypothetical protein